MERNISETFYYNGKCVQVVRSYSLNCDRCYFRNIDCYNKEIRDIIGECFPAKRSDHTLVEFRLIDKYDEQYRK